jgi:hypothetical protein
MTSNQRFLEHASRVIREEPNHPLRFLLNDRDRVATLERGNINIYDGSFGAIYSGPSSELVSRMKPNEVASELGVSVSCDACHLTTKNHGAPERFAIGIAEDNRGHGHDEKSIELMHDAISIGNVPVIKDSAEKWEAAGLLEKGTVGASNPDNGWSCDDANETSGEIFWKSVKQDVQFREGQLQEHAPEKTEVHKP